MITVLPAPAPVLTIPSLPLTLSCTEGAAFISAPDATYSNKAPGSCLISGTIKAVITPAYTPCEGGIISVKYEAADVCGHALNKTITISVRPCPPTAVELTPGAATCKQDNGTLLIGAITGGTAPYSYAVDGGSYVSKKHFTGLSDGLHTVEVQDANGCLFRATTTIGRQALILSSDFSAQGCSRYPLPWGEVATQSGDYQHTYQSIGGCDSVVTAHILIKQPSASLTPVAICSNQIPYIWNRKRYYLPGTYTFRTVNASGCDSVASLQLMINQSTNGPTDSITVCSNALPFHWNGMNINQAGRYTAAFQNQAGCDSIVQLVFVTSPMATAEVSGDNPICSGSTTLTLQLTGVAPWTLVYTDGAVKDTIRNIISSPYVLTVAPTQTTTYTLLSVYDAKCSNTSLTSFVTVKVVPPPPGVRYPDVMAAPGVSKELKARDFGSTARYLWDPSIGLNINTLINPVFNYDSTVLYTIIISTGNGCRVVDTLRVLVPVSAPAILSDIFVPRAWSPNKDNHNDALQPLCINIQEIYYFRIFNRWGQLMFETRQRGQGWNGVYKGMPQVQDIYTWTLEALGEDGKHYKRSGNSILLR
jgi:gliding motility-associated-like protein